MSNLNPKNAYKTKCIISIYLPIQVTTIRSNQLKIYFEKMVRWVLIMIFINSLLIVI